MPNYGFCAIMQIFYIPLSKGHQKHGLPNKSEKNDMIATLCPDRNRILPKLAIKHFKTSGFKQNESLSLAITLMVNLRLKF